jgi:hypothetical protein
MLFLVEAHEPTGQSANADSEDPCNSGVSHAHYQCLNGHQSKMTAPRNRDVLSSRKLMNRAILGFGHVRSASYAQDKPYSRSDREKILLAIGQ